MRLSQLFTKNADGGRDYFNPIVDEVDVLPTQSDATKGQYLKSNGTRSEWATLEGSDIRFLYSKITSTETSAGSVTFNLGKSQLAIVFVDGILAREGESYTIDKTDESDYKLIVDTTELNVGTEICVYDFISILAGGGGGGGGSITVDSALSTTSANPVQNAVITAKINDLQAQFDNYNTAIKELIAKYEG